ncbi:hypothetical protein [Flavobacterium sp.]|uniref:hypothetical protein n=1 Tax=Flavobacterium sp. TaxID=239 RepID=UPI002FDA864E
MTENELIIKFGGDGNIKVDTLTNFLEIYKELLYIINNELGYNPDDLVIEVSPPEHGSFEIRISPRYRNQILAGIGAIVVSTLGGLLTYYLTDDNQDKTLEEIKVILEKQAKVDKDIPKNVYNIYQNTGAEQKITQSFITVNNDGNVTSLKVNQDNDEIIDIPKKEFPKYIEKHEAKPKEIIRPIQDVIRDEVTLIIKTIHFEGHAKWAFVYRGYPIKAEIKDETFFEKLNTEAFRKGDSLIVRLATTRNFDNDLQTYIVDQNSYVIEKVIEHKSKVDIQNKLSLEE